MARIDFFIEKCQTLGITEKEFGICDNDDAAEKTPAYVSFADKHKWCATVINNSGNSLNFTAVDNCIEVYIENGDIENRCDAMLSNQDYLIFIELKVVRKNWLSHAVEQLQATIDVFKENNDISRYNKIQAFACNRKHPNFSYSNKELKQVFFHKNGFRLYDQATIEIK